MPVRVPACMYVCKDCVVCVLMCVNVRACIVNVCMRAQARTSLFVCCVSCLYSCMFASNMQMTCVHVYVLVHVQGVCDVCSCACAC